MVHAGGSLEKHISWIMVIPMRGPVVAAVVLAAGAQAVEGNSSSGRSSGIGGMGLGSQELGRLRVCCFLGNLLLARCSRFSNT